MINEILVEDAVRLRWFERDPPYNGRKKITSVTFDDDARLGTSCRNVFQVFTKILSGNCSNNCKNFHSPGVGIAFDTRGTDFTVPSGGRDECSLHAINIYSVALYYNDFLLRWSGPSRSYTTGG